MKIQLEQIINLGNYDSICDRIKQFDNSDLQISEFSISLISPSGQIFNSQLKKVEEDIATQTFIGQYEDGTLFRLIRPSEINRIIMKTRNLPERISLGGLTGNSYAIHFRIFNS